MYSIELSLRYSPFPISIQKKEYEEVRKIYDEIKAPDVKKGKKDKQTSDCV